ncbi:bifunctional diguanylate cyclase/phosphodiesterase [Desulfovibrio oxyclinae]|uniref:bifunctional diguanylate cyclase/phosphodiesterase n=1 Tax=Desulfovibrio oxyclinae TaxID=63560 RepID=UPI00037B3068|nr:EAL domain-containing protein [Desulfovibrio oxyclinae]
MAFITRLLRTVRIRTRLLLGFTVLLTAALLATAFTVNTFVSRVITKDIDQELRNTNRTLVSMMEAAVDVSVRNHLRAVAESNRQVVKGLHQRQLDGEFTPEEARARARKILLSQNIGQTGYLYCLNSSGRTVVHPHEEVEHSDTSDYSFVRHLMQVRRGYIEYDWRNPDDLRPMQKAVYAEYFAPWDWIIAASAYRHEFSDLITADDFRDTFESLHFGESGYAFVVDRNGDVLLHPDGLQNIAGLTDERGQDIGSSILNERNGIIRYWWKGGPNGEVREKFAMFKHMPEMGWIVASTGYVDEVYAPLREVRILTYGICGVTLVLVLSLCLAVAASITDPLDELTEAVQHAENGDYSVRSNDTHSDEIGNLARSYNRFMEALVLSVSKLEAETEYRKFEAFQRHLFEEVFENALEGICITDPDGSIIAVNPAFTTITGYAEEAVLGHNPSVLKSDRHDEGFYADMWQKIQVKGHWAGEIWNRRKSGEVYPELLSISAIYDSEGNVRHYVSVFHDMTDIKRKEEQLYMQAYHDALTGLPNRELLLDRLVMALRHARREESGVGLLFIDLDNFKNINDSLGHSVGDVLLQQAGQRAKLFGNPDDTVARYGGDEFVLLVNDVNERDLVRLAQTLLEDFQKPFHVNGREIFVTTSVGMSLFPEDAEDPETLVRNAEMAMYQAKSSGKDSYSLFAKEMDERIARRLELEGNLRNALRKREFVVHYQPKVALSSGRVVGAEALVRWALPDGTMVSPGEFIPLAEETGMIVQLGEQVLETVCTDMAERNFPEGFRVSVNLSANQFRQEDLLGSLRSIVESAGVSPGRIEFEVTESVLMHDIDENAKILQRLVDMGFSVSIDDFGTGHSSLFYLKKLPISTLKIDRSFVRELGSNPSDSLIVQTILLMAGSLNLSVVAEGVEEQQQADLLMRYGCGTAQGFLFAKPVPFREFLALMKIRNS